MKKQTILHLLFIGIICIGSRLFFLLNSGIDLDGDECIVGLMSKHFIEGKEIPLFFYGQSYGFSFVEVLFIGLSYLFIGITPVAIKVGMLVLWMIGTLFFNLTLKSLHQTKSNIIPLLFSIVLIFCSSWFFWSIKARGGYVTAFTLSNILFYLLVRKKTNNIYWNIFIGFLLVIIYQAQPLWIACISPFMVLYTIQSRYKILPIFGSLITTALLFYFYKMTLSNFWSPRVVDIEHFNIKRITGLLNFSYQNLHGNYDYSTIGIPNFYAHWQSIGLLMLIPFVLAKVIIYLLKRKVDFVFYTAVVSLGCTIGYAILIEQVSPRYLLPLTVPLLLTGFLFLKTIKTKWIPITYSSIIILLGIINLSKIPHFDISHRAKTVDLVSKLEQNKITHALSMDGLLQWEIMFYSQERIIARYFAPTDRYPAHVKNVNKCLSTNPESVAVVANLTDDKPTLIAPNFYIDSVYWGAINITTKKAKKLGFKFDE